MQIIERSLFGIRSAIIDLKSNNEATCFRLFPMMHVADQEFYNEVSLRLGECDVILYEGVKSFTTTLITASYRYFATSPRLGLVLQSSMKLDHLKDRIIHADISPPEFEKRWSKLDLAVRILLPILSPLYGLYMRYFGTRADIIRHSSVDLLKAREDISIPEWNREVKDIILNWRDEKLIEVIDQVRHQNKKQTVAVVWGANHMRAVIYHLIKQPQPAYRVHNAEWVNVIKP